MALFGFTKLAGTPEHSVFLFYHPKHGGSIPRDASHGHRCCRSSSHPGYIPGKKDLCQLRPRPTSSIYRWSHGHLLFAREAGKCNFQLEALCLPRKIKILSKRREDDTRVLACHEVISSFFFFFLQKMPPWISVAYYISKKLIPS